MSSAETFIDQSAVVASASVPDGVRLTHHIDGHPESVALGHLARLLATGTFNRVRSNEFHSDSDWETVVQFVEQAIGPVGFQSLGRYKSSLFVYNDHVGVSVHVRWNSDYEVHVAAVDDPTCARWMAAFADLLPEPPPPPPPVRPDNVVPVAFWMQDPHSGEGYARRRDITVTRFPEVAGNYPGRLRGRLEKLMGIDAPSTDGSGKLILFHGPPGTGKTRAILTLISEWRNWCSASVVTDADRFFGDPTYINSIVFGAQGMCDWMLLVVEDGDEYMNVRGRDSKGQSIARLLNLADGIVGQGINLLTLITTNVPMAELNPAIVRPGRALANLHFGSFDTAEANSWLADHGHDSTVDREATLAELYATLRGDEPDEVI